MQLSERRLSGACNPGGPSLEAAAFPAIARAFFSDLVRGPGVFPLLSSSLRVANLAGGAMSVNTLDIPPGRHNPGVAACTRDKSGAGKIHQSRIVSLDRNPKLAAWTPDRFGKNCIRTSSLQPGTVLLHRSRGASQHRPPNHDLDRGANR